MTKRIAFLRGINLGSHNVKMDRLRALVGELGFTDVETFIASGNVIFEAGSQSARAIESAIEDKLAASLGYEVATFVRTSAQLAKVASDPTFDGAAGTLHVVFLKRKPGAPAGRALHALETARDRLHVAGTEILWSTAGGFSAADIKIEAIAKLLDRQPVTVRNMNTVRKLAAKYG